MSIPFFLVTLGCKVNQYESRALAERWQLQGHFLVAEAADASLVLINSCAVTAKAVAEVRHAVRRLSRVAPQAKLVITGCAAQVQQEELATLEGLHAIVPQPLKGHLLACPLEVVYAAGFEAYKDLAPYAPSVSENKESAGEPADGAETGTGTFPSFSISGYDRTRAVVKMQDGCSHRCTYCIVPLARGRSSSRPLHETMAEIERLLAAGFREIGLNGVNLRQYGPDLTPPHDFWDALMALEERFAPQWAGRLRFRISSLEPGQLTEKALHVLGSSRLVAPHLHISLQSGSRGVLKRMGRGHYDPQSVVSFMERLAHVRPLLGLGADILTGFPGETSEEYDETLALCQALPFSYAHVFPYSRRPGTVAAAMGGQLAGPVKKERAAALRGLLATKQQAFLQRMLGLSSMHVAVEGHQFAITEDDAMPAAPKAETVTHLPVLPEGMSEGASRGINEYYVECRFAGALPAQADGTFVAARPVGVAGTVLLVEPLVPGHEYA